MTTQQDKELSSVIENLLHVFWLRCRMSAVEFENMPEVKAARALAASPQLPVAEQPAGKAVSDVARQCVELVANGFESTTGIYDELICDVCKTCLDDGAPHAADCLTIKARALLNAAPHSPVAPNCGACPGDGSICKSACQHDAENPPVAQMSGEPDATQVSLHTFLNAAAGEGLALDGVDAADLYNDVFGGRADHEAFRIGFKSPSNAAATVPPVVQAPSDETILAIVDWHVGSNDMRACDKRSLCNEIRELFASPAAIDVRDAAIKRLLAGNGDLYQLLMMVANGIDSPASCTLARNAIIAIDNLQSPPQTGKESQ